MDTVSVCIDIGTDVTKAVCVWSQGPVMPLLVDDEPSMPSGVYVDPDGTIRTGIAALRCGRADPSRYLRDVPATVGGASVTLGERTVEPADLLAAILRRVTAEVREQTGAEPAQTVLVTPQHWGPRRYTVLRAAAAAAGITDPVLVPAPVAAAHHLARTAAVDIPVGGFVLICDLGATGGRGAVLQRTAEAGWDLLSSIEDPDAGGDRIDQLLLERAGIAAVGADTAVFAADPGLRRSLQRAKHDSALGDRTTIAVPGNEGAGLRAGTIDPGTLAAADVETAPKVADLGVRALAGADVDRGALCATVLVGGAVLPEAEAALSKAVDGQVSAVPRPAQAAVHGARQVLGSAPADRRPWAAALPADGWIWRILGIVVTGAGSLMLFIHAFSTGYVSRSDQFIDFIIFNSGEFAMGCALAMICAVLSARAVALALIDSGATLGDKRTWIGEPARAFLVAAGCAVAGCVIYAMISAITLHLGTGTYLGLAARTALPGAVLASWIAAVTPRITYLGGAAFNRLRLSILGTALAIGGIVLTQTAASAHIDQWHADLIGRLGGLLLGAGCGATLTRRLLARLVAMTVFGLIGALSFEARESLDIGYAYVVCLYLWLLVQTVAITIDAYPRLWPRTRRMHLTERSGAETNPVG